MIDSEKYNIDCAQPCTVLKAIKSLNIYEKLVKCPDVNVIILRGTGDDQSVLPTHCPCSCIGDGEVLKISTTERQVGEAKDEPPQVYSKDHYSVFYIVEISQFF